MSLLDNENELLGVLDDQIKNKVCIGGSYSVSQIYVENIPVIKKYFDASALKKESRIKGYDPNPISIKVQIGKNNKYQKCTIASYISNIILGIDTQYLDALYIRNFFKKFLNNNYRNNKVTCGINQYTYSNNLVIELWDMNNRNMRVSLTMKHK